jgi:enamine deaminase RidA (YjgF/YER057c/UK114 family)
MRSIQVYNPDKGKSFEIKVINTLNNIIKNTANKHVVKLDFYIDSNSQEDFQNEYGEIKSIIKDLFKDKTPAFTVISQAPEENKELIVVCHSYEKNLNIKYKSILDHPYVTVLHNNGLELISGGIQFSEDPFLLGTQRAFDFAEQILMAEDLNFGHIYRQWNYIPDILHISSMGGSDKQNYQIFNEVRSIFYEQPLFKSGFPAATGIGCKYGAVTIDFIAFENHTENIKSIESSIQRNAFEYSNDVLIGCTLNGSIEKAAPLFERAKYSNIDSKEIWISGTASIESQETKFLDDIEKQTLHTLKSIFSLIDNTSLSHNDIISSSEKPLKDCFQEMVIYVKHQSDIPKVKEIVTHSLPTTPCLFLNADICRDNLLVEIEGLVSFDI